jgi:hypothetical protein
LRLRGLAEVKGARAIARHFFQASLGLFSSSNANRTMIASKACAAFAALGVTDVSDVVLRVLTKKGAKRPKLE